MRVCILSPLFHPLVGGPGRQAFIMARQLISRGVNVIVISRRLSGVRNEVQDIEVHYVSTFSPDIYNLSEFTLRNFIISISFSLGAIIKLLRLRNRFEIVQFYGASLPLLMCLPILKMLGKKVVAKTTGGRGGKEAGGLKGFLFKPLLVAIFRHTDKLIAISDDILQRLLDEGFPEERTVKIPNGVDAEKFSPPAKPEREKLRKGFEFMGKNVFLYSGRIVQGKGLELLVEAMAGVVNTNKDIIFAIIGSGDLEVKLREMVSALKLEDYIRFEGNIENVNDYLNASDIFVFPSYTEGMPNSLLEAMACGLPVIASKIGGVVDVVEDGKSGILVEPGDISGLASAMVRLLKDNLLRQRLGEEARKRIVERFSIDRVAEEYIKLYKKI